MSWSPLLPRQPEKAVRKLSTISASTTAGSGRTSAALSLVFRVAALDGVKFLTPGAGLQVLVGGGNHAGMLRIMPDGLHRLSKSVGRGASGGLLMLRLPLPPGVAAAKRPSTPLDFDYQDGWIEVTLPDWSKAPADASPAAADAAPAEPRAVVLARQAAEIARRKAGR